MFEAQSHSQPHSSAQAEPAAQNSSRGGNLTAFTATDSKAEQSEFSLRKARAWLRQTDLNTTVII